jgi:hypothetical protein
MQMVLMLIQSGTLLLMLIGAYVSLKKPGRTDSKQARPKGEDIKASAS